MNLLKNRLLYNRLIESCPSISNIEIYAKIVWERYIKRQAIKSARVLARAAEDNNKTISDVLL